MLGDRESTPGCEQSRIPQENGGSPPRPTLSIYDEMCGITLCPNLDISFDKYEFGLRFVAQVKNSSFLVFYSYSLVDELRMRMNAISFLHLTGQRAGNTLYLELCQTFPHPSALYMGP